VKLLVFDSGIGGLGVAREIRKALPSADIDYVADDSGFPYGAWEERALADRVVGVVGDLVAAAPPNAIVIACNTASTLVLPPLRERHAIPIVGTVPAIKPAAERTRSGHVSVLATFGTMQRDYTRALIREFAGHCLVQLVGSANLASLAEAHMRGEIVDDAAIWAEIAPAFVERDGARTDVVVLACTHYPFLIERFERLAPWPVTWIDPAPAIARRVVAVLGGDAPDGAGSGRAWLTSCTPWPDVLTPILRSINLAPVVVRGGLTVGDGAD
jgi:glutamate racemase